MNILIERIDPEDHGRNQLNEGSFVELGRIPNFVHGTLTVNGTDLEVVCHERGDMLTVFTVDGVLRDLEGYTIPVPVGGAKYNCTFRKVITRDEKEVLEQLAKIAGTYVFSCEETLEDILNDVYQHTKSWAIKGRIPGVESPWLAEAITNLPTLERMATRFNIPLKC